MLDRDGVPVAGADHAVPDFVPPGVGLRRLHDLIDGDRLPPALRGQRARHCIQGREASTIEHEPDLIGAMPQHERKEAPQPSLAGRMCHASTYGFGS